MHRTAHARTTSRRDEFHVSVKDLSTADLLGRLASVNREKTKADDTATRLAEQLKGERATQRLLGEQHDVLTGLLSARR